MPRRNEVQVQIGGLQSAQQSEAAAQAHVRGIAQRVSDLQVLTPLR